MAKKCKSLKDRAVEAGRKPMPPCMKGNKPEPTHQVALEDLVTMVISGFVDHIDDLGCDGPVTEWYGSLTDKQRFDLSDQLLEILKKEGEKK
jgi:hypothetical protein